jgi:PIN domain nuclease of toxin-antitoxin system
MEGARISEHARHAIEGALAARSGVHVSPISAWEIATLPGTPPRDPADRIIAATSRTYGFVVITRDGELIPYGEARHIEAVCC